MRQKIMYLLAGMAFGMALLSTGGALAPTSLTATPSSHGFYIDGRRVTLTAYEIGGNNYLKLRDIGQAVGFNVYWDGTVQIESDKCQRRRDFVVFRRTENVEKWRVKVYSL